MSAMASQTSASLLFTKTFIQAQIKEKIKATRHWPLCGEFTGSQWISHTKGPITRKMFQFDDVIMSCGVGDPDQHWFRKWLVAWLEQAITRTNVDLSSMKFSDTNLMANSQDISQTSINKISFTIMYLNFIKISKGPMNSAEICNHGELYFEMSKYMYIHDPDLKHV